MRQWRVWRRLAIGLLALGLSGCATVRGTPDPRDPWEGYNRAMFEFNDAVDRAVLKPAAKGYRAITPKAVDDSVSNFFSNLGDIPNALNNALQGKFVRSLQDINRVVYNTTFGIGGLFDVASHMGLPKSNEDFGQTLGVWGVDAGPYLVLPILGPSTLRDTGGRVVDGYTHPLRAVDDETLVWSLAVLRVIDIRADLLDIEKRVDEVAFDRYITIRNGYLDRREYLIYDGNPPRSEEDDLLRELERIESGG